MKTGKAKENVMPAEAKEAVEEPPVDSIRRALDAAEAANEAAQDIATLSAAHKAFAEAVMKGQRRNTLFASGAAAGAAVAIALGGVVYFRAVADLRVASAVQSEAAALLVEELTQFDHVGDAIEEQQKKMRDETLDLLEQVKDEIRRAAMNGGEAEAEPAEDPMTAQIATELRTGIKTDLDATRDEILGALAELHLTASGADTAELTALIAELKALAGKGAAVENKKPDTAAKPSKPAKPKPKPAANETNPFTYP